MSRSLPDVDTLITTLALGVGHDDGEDVDLLDHALQCAAVLAVTAPPDLHLQVAGLVHDVGTILEPDRPDTHAQTGAAAVAALLGAEVATLVGSHDDAKRYLVTVDDAYRSRLSERSIETLRAQGGTMTPREVAAFEATDHFESRVALRRADDAAKVIGREVPGLDSWREALEGVASNVRA